MKKAPCYKGGGSIKGEPNKPKTTTIDRSKYSDILSKPIDGSGTNFISNDQSSFTPEVLKANGYNYVSGTMGGKDIVYEKNGNYHLYNEQPNAKENKYGLINIGNGSTPDTNNTSLNTAAPAVSTSTYVDPNRKPINFSNPNMVYDPNTGGYKNPTTGAVINPRVENYNNGGKVKKAPRGYATAGNVVPQYSDGTINNGQGAVIAPAGNSSTGFASSFANANQANQDQIAAENQAKKDKQNAQIKAGADTAGRVLGAYGTAYYATNPGDNAGEQTRSATLGAASNTGAIGGAIGGIAAIGDSIGKPIKSRSERTDTDGNLLDPTAAKRNAVIGSLFSPSKALAFRGQYKGGWTDVSGNGYLNYLQNQAKSKINEQRQAAIDADNAARTATNNGNFNSALQARNDNQDYTNDNLYKSTNPKPLLPINNNTTASLYGGKSWLQRTFKDGGTIEGAGTGKSDSIKAKVKADTFIVPEENAPIAEELREKVLKKAPKKKADLNQKGGEDVRLSNGEHMFSPEEKAEIERYGYDVDALAPNAKGGEEMEFAPGGEIPSSKEAAGMIAKKKANDLAERQQLLTTKNNLENSLKNPNDKNKYYNQAALNGVNKRIQDIESLHSDIKNNENNSNSNIDYFNGSKNKIINNQNNNLKDYTQSNDAAATKKAPTGIMATKQAVLADTLQPNTINQIPLQSSGNNLYANRNASEIARANQVASNSPNEGNGLATIPTNQAGTSSPAQTNGQQRNGLNWQGALDTAINYGIPIAQTAIGLNKLKKLGARPVDHLDPDYINAINQTRGLVTQAQDQAKYGYTGAEQTDLNNQNTGLTEAGRFDARNFSGGSAGNALNMERSVINDSFGRDLSQKVSDSNLKLQKQQIAADRQGQLSDMLSHKQDLNNRLFNNSLAAWTQDQASAGNLLNAGLSNAIDSHRYEKFKKDYANSNINQG